MEDKPREVLSPEEQLPLHKQIKERIRQLRLVEYFDEAYEEDN